MPRSLQTRRILFSTVLAAGLTIIAGCGSPYDASVSGIVNMDGKPLPAGTRVVFNPASSGPSGYGLIDDSGAYSVMTGMEDGLPSGDYVLTVVANEPSVPNANPNLPPTPGKPLTPAWYRSPQQSPLKYTVEPGSNEINLELDTKPPAGWKPIGRS